MRLCKYLSIQFAIENLLKRRLKISRWHELNDPFELRGARSSNILYNSLLLQAAKASGVLCFSKTESEPLLWSHYANNHRGCCIVFDIENQFVGGQPVIREVVPVLSPKILEIDFQALAEKLVQGRQAGLRQQDVVEEISKDPTINLLSEAVLLSKYQGWSYEKEVRMLFLLQSNQFDGGHYFADFEATMRPVEILLGARCTDEDVRDFHYAAHSYDPPLPIIRMSMADDSFEIVRLPRADRFARRAWV